jgi:hypothetical protein
MFYYIITISERHKSTVESSPPTFGTFILIGIIFAIMLLIIWHGNSD